MTAYASPGAALKWSEYAYGHQSKIGEYFLILGSYRDFPLLKEV